MPILNPPMHALLIPSFLPGDGDNLYISSPSTSQKFEKRKFPFPIFIKLYISSEPNTSSKKI